MRRLTIKKKEKKMRTAHFPSKNKIKCVERNGLIYIFFLFYTRLRNQSDRYFLKGLFTFYSATGHHPKRLFNHINGLIKQKRMIKVLILFNISRTRAFNLKLMAVRVRSFACG